MAVVTHRTPEGLTDLQNGLKRLYGSPLMAIREFKDMYLAIERHTRDVMLVHLTGSGRDIQEKTIRDTMFYTILVAMLFEVQSHSAESQSEILRQVHAWYMTNRRDLICGPRFGKDNIKLEARRILHKDIMLTHQSPARSAEEQQQKLRLEASLATEIISEREGAAVNCQEVSLSPAATPQEGDDAQEAGFPLGEELSSASESNSATNSPDFYQINLELQFDLDGNEQLLHKSQGSVEEIDYTSAESPSPSSPRLSLIPPVVTPGQLSTIQKQRNRLTEKVVTVRKSVHPICSLIRPHSSTRANLPTKETQVRQGKPSQNDSLKAWQNFQKLKSARQEVISKLSFLGRSGTPIDVRYSAHGRGESPEFYTQDFLEYFARHGNLLKHENCVENVLVQKTLQEFFKTAEEITPPSWNTFKNSLSATKVKSASSVNHSGQKTQEKSCINEKSKPKQKFGHNFDKILASWFENTEKPLREPDTGISLSTVVDVVDYVTDSLTCHKEKLAPEPQLGFRQPSTTGLTMTRELTSSSSFDVTIDYGSCTPSVICNNENEAARPILSPLMSSLMSGKAAPDGLRKAKIRCVSAEVVDCRGKVRPEGFQNRWPQATFGRHTYLKKWHRPNQHSCSSGITSASGRPKTAPLTAKGKWKTHPTSAPNLRAVQAASHTTTIVDQEDVESLMKVHHLLPNENRYDSADIFMFENTERIKHGQVTTEPRVTEYLSFVAPSATSVVEQGPDKNTFRVWKDDDKAETRRQKGFSETSDVPHDDGGLPHYSEDALNRAVSEELRSLAQEYGHRSATIESRNKEARKKYFACGSQFTPDHLGPGSFQHDNMAARVQRSAGRVPGHTSAHTKDSSHLRNEALRKVFPPRTPASIPTSTMIYSNSKIRGGQMFLELEHHARRTNNPAEYMKKVDGLRQADNSQQPCFLTHFNEDSLLGTSLQIRKHPVSSRGRSSEILAQSHHLPTTTKSITSVGCCPGTTVSDGHSSRTIAPNDEDSNRTTASNEGLAQGHRPSEDQFIQGGTGVNVPASKLANGRGMPGGHTTSCARSVSKAGRPIAQVFQTPDPEEMVRAVKVQNEAAAAVSIQRIFRGFVARNVYKSLLSEERQRREDARKAAVRIQRIYRSHVRRKQAIYNRSLVNPQLVQWSRGVAETQARNCAKRDTRLAGWTSELSSRHKEAKTKLSVIGPHVEVYSAYHPKVVGPKKHELDAAATTIQKLVRGWLLRRKMNKLVKKALWCGSSFTKLAHDYKAMLKRVQQQHGVDKPKTPFTFKDFSSYIDLRRRYESVFEKRSFGGELEIGSLEAYFQECELYPSRAELEEAIDVTTHGQARRRDRKGVTKKELMDITFYIYVPVATGLHGTRRSTWMSPIIDGREARQLLGSEFVEPAPLAPCFKLVVDAKREQRQREQAQREANQRRRIEESERRMEDDKQATRKVKKVVFQVTATTKDSSEL